MLSLRRSQRQAATAALRSSLPTNQNESSQLSPNCVLENAHKRHVSSEVVFRNRDNEKHPLTLSPLLLSSVGISPISVTSPLHSPPIHPPSHKIDEGEEDMSGHTYPLLHLGFTHSLDLCHHLCALKTLVTTSDGEPLTDDTVCVILKHHYGTPEYALDCSRLYDYLMTNRKIEEGNEAVRGIWREIEERFEEWARRAMRCYWEWMEYMRGVWERFWVDGRQQELKMMCHWNCTEEEKEARLKLLNGLVAVSRPPGNCLMSGMG